MQGEHNYFLCNTILFKKTMMKCIMLLLAVFLIAGCNTTDSNIAGGPCSYRDESIPVKVLSVVPSADTDECNLLLQLEDAAMGIKDTLSYFFETKKHLNTTILQQKNIRVGDSILLLNSVLITGDCTPNIRRIILEKFSRR
jgi:hypothetical protein